MSYSDKATHTQPYPCVHRVRGATLPDVYHEFYDEVEQENPASISYGCLQIILRRDLTGSRELHFNVYKQLKRRGFYPSSNLQSSENARLVQEIVREIRPTLNSGIFEGGKPVSQQLNESEYYLQAALSKLIVKFQMLWLDTYNRDRLSRRSMQQTATRQLKFLGGKSKIRIQCTKSQPPNRDVPLLLCQGLSKVPVPSIRSDTLSPTSRDLDWSESTSSNFNDEETIIEVERPNDASLYGQQRSRTLSPTRQSDPGTVHAQDSRPQSRPSAIDVQAVHLREMVQRFGQDFQAIVEQISTLERKKALLECRETSERARKLEQQVVDLEYDNAYLGYTLAHCESVIRGDQDDLIAHFSDAGLTGVTVERLLQNFRFQNKFFGVQKRKREVDDVGVKDEEDT